mmetsp:Transcript_27070/g.80009  ORF Transcript_27070/g.80009 Transcript_27070/m.80009 type:complete len:202 (+) Transcript_27070:1350-1955(+)
MPRSKAPAALDRDWATLARPVTASMFTGALGSLRARVGVKRVEWRAAVHVRTARLREAWRTVLTVTGPSGMFAELCAAWCHCQTWRRRGRAASRVGVGGCAGGAAPSAALVAAFGAAAGEAFGAAAGAAFRAAGGAALGAASGAACGAAVGVGPHAPAPALASTVLMERVASMRTAKMSKVVTACEDSMAWVSQGRSMMQL